MSGGKPTFLAVCRGSSLSCLRKRWRGSVRHKPEWITTSHELTTYMTTAFSYNDSFKVCVNHEHPHWGCFSLGCWDSCGGPPHDFLHCDVAFLQPDELEGIWRWPAETRAEAQVSRHVFLLKSALKNQPKWLAKDHPGYLWQWQVNSALLFQACDLNSGLSLVFSVELGETRYRDFQGEKKTTPLYSSNLFKG